MSTTEKRISRFVGTMSIDEILRSDIAQETAEYPVPLTLMRKHDALGELLPTTAANDDMALVTGTPGTDAPTLQGVDFGGTSSDEKCAFEFALPPEYVAGQPVTLRVRAAILTTLSDGTLTLDAEAWAADGDGGVSGDLCTTSAIDINSLTVANRDFTINPATLVAGNKLIVRLSFAGSDTGNAGEMIPEIASVALRLGIRG